METTNLHRIMAAAVILSLASGSAKASSGTEGAAFLDIPVGAGPAALGSAYTPLAMDAYAPVWNPSGLALLEGNELAAQHLSYLESMHYEYLSYVHPFQGDGSSPARRGLGVSAQYLASGDIPGMDISGNSTGDFSSHWGSYNLAYGQSLSDKLSLGLTGKWINAKIDDVSANAYAADLGSFYRVSDKLHLAATVNNLGTKIKFLSEGDDLPMAVHVGAAYEPNSKWTLASEGVYRKTGLASWHMGAAWRPMEAISLRAGYKTDTLDGLSPLAGLTTGIGIHVWGQELAYAWSPYGDLGAAQYFSLLCRFGGDEKSERRNLIHYQTIKKHRTVRRSSDGSASNGGRTSVSDDSEPEYQQLMQLLNDSDSHVAQSNRSNRSAE